MGDAEALDEFDAVPPPPRRSVADDNDIEAAGPARSRSPTRSMNTSGIKAAFVNKQRARKYGRLQDEGCELHAPPTAFDGQPSPCTPHDQATTLANTPASCIRV